MSSHLECLDVTVSPDGAPVLRGLCLEVAAGERTVLVGPSGAGKTTLLRAIAGLASLDAGDIRLGGRSLRGVATPRRRIAVVFQEPRLLPHLDVTDNVALPLRAAGVRKAQRRALARMRLSEVGLAGLVDRRPPGLSGGEQQRVALARALCAEPDLLLLDEPLASLDPNRREELRRLVVRVQRERELTTLIVTHDRTEAAQLGERIALMLEGRIVQHDEPRKLFEQPVSAAVARFFGVRNLLHGSVRAGRLQVAGIEVAVPGPDGSAIVAIRPEHVRLDGDSPLRGTVVEAVYSGSHVHVAIQCGDQRIEAQLPVGEGPRAGEEVGVELALHRLWRLPDGEPVRASAAPARRAGRP